MSSETPKRLLLEEGEASPLVDLLRAANEDGPTPARLERIGANVARATAPAPAPTKAPGRVIDARPRFSRMSVRARVVALVIAATIGTAFAYEVAKRMNAPAPVQAPVQPLPTTHRIVAPPKPSEAPRVEEPTVDVASLPSAPPRHEAPAASTNGSPSEEIAILERAQSAVESNPREAIALCKEHASRFPSGRLVEEREAIAIEALVRTGDVASATSRLGRFETSYPSSAHAPRLKALVTPK